MFDAGYIKNIYNLIDYRTHRAKGPFFIKRKPDSRVKEYIINERDQMFYHRRDLHEHQLVTGTKFKSAAVKHPRQRWHWQPVL